jgi:multicomponent Na+:H+ antiporter subunit E
VSAVALGAFLVVIWVFLWGYLTVANVLSGIVVVTVLLLIFPTSRRVAPKYVVRPIPLLRFVVHFARNLVEANVVLAREVLSRQDRIRTGVVEVPLTGCTDRLLAFAANVIALTPGTLAIEVSNDPPLFYVHVLHLHDVDQVRREVRHMQELIVRAFGSPKALAALESERT